MLIADNDKRRRLDDICLQQENEWSLVWRRSPGCARAFKINIKHLSSYTQKVLNRTRLVPVGYVTTYGAIAKVARGSPRSVGRVEASNPVPLLIPCHRVVRSDLSAGGYGGGGQRTVSVSRRVG